MDELKDICRQFLAQGTEVMVDSGAHTFFAEKGIGTDNVPSIKQTQSHTDYPAYMSAYLDWLQELEFYTAAVELDIQALVGMDQVHQWQQDALARGIHLVLVGHPKDTPHFDEEWVRMCKMASEAPHRWVAVQGGLQRGMYQRCFTVAHNTGVKVHGFAMTKPEAMERWGFDTVDSTSWLSGSRFGSTYFLRGKRLECDSDKKVRRRLQHWYSQWSVNGQGVLDDVVEDVDHANALAWSLYGQGLLTPQEQASSRALAARFHGRWCGAAAEQQSVVNQTSEHRQEQPTAPPLPGASELVRDGREQLPPHDDTSNPSQEKHDERGVEGVSDETLLPTQPQSEEKGGKAQLAPSVSVAVSTTSNKQRPTDIQQRLQNPAIERKRKEAVRASNSRLAHRWTTGEYAKRPLPIVCSDACYAATKCTVKQFGSLCAVRADLVELSSALHSQNPHTVLSLLTGIMEENLVRLKLGMQFEAWDGGALDKQVTNLSNSVMDWGKLLVELKQAIDGTGNPGGLSVKAEAGSQVNILNLHPEDLRGFARQMALKPDPPPEPSLKAARATDAEFAHKDVPA